MGVNKTTDILTDAGRRFLATCKALASKPRVEVGILGKDFKKPKKVRDEKGASKNTTLGKVAAANEFGTKDGRVPERSFIRATVDKKRAEWNGLVEKLKDRVLAGSLTTDQALGLIGERIKRDIQAAIRSNIGPPNAASTIAAKLGRAGLKGRALRKAEIAAAFGQGTLRDTGQLINAIAWELFRNGSDDE